MLKVDDIYYPNNELTAASSSGWIERDNKVAIVAAFKLVLPLTRGLAATLGFPRTRPTFEGEGLHPKVLSFKCFLEDACIASRYRSTRT